MKMEPITGLIGAEEALHRLLREIEPVDRFEVVPLSHALGRVAAEEVRAPRPVPAFRRATWDGYAVRSRDLKAASPKHPVPLRLVGEIHAEESYPHPLGSGETVAIATGAPLPIRADAVVLFEEVKVHGAEVLFRHPADPGESVAQPGEDFRQGERILSPGEFLTPPRLGALGAVGRRTVRVRARPKVALVPNGNELLPPGAPLTPGKIHEFNNFTLGALIEAAGGIPILYPPVPDDPPRIREVLEEALRRADLVIATGGSSVGERDFLPRIFPSLGRMLFRGIRVRPGKPTLAAKVRGKVLLGMPGHPTSCLSNGYWLLWPVLRKLAGLTGTGMGRTEARLSRPYEPPTEGFTAILPVRLERGWAIPTYRGSSAIHSLTGAHGYAVVRPGRRELPRGSRLVVHLFPPPLA